MNGLVDAQRPRTRGGIIGLAFTPFSGTGSLKGFGDFYVARWHLRIFGCTCHRQGDGLWVQLPSKPLIDKAELVLRDEQSSKIRKCLCSRSTPGKCSAELATPRALLFTHINRGETDEVFGRPHHRRPGRKDPTGP